jgi:hypothetical protein
MLRRYLYRKAASLNDPAAVAVQKRGEHYRRLPTGDVPMKPKSTVPDRILEAVASEPSCRIDDLVAHFPDLTWIQIFIEVNRLSLNGQLSLMLDGQGVFTVRRSDAVMPLQPVAHLQMTR